MTLQIHGQPGEKALTIYTEGTASCEFEVMADGSLEIYTDNGKDSYSGDNRCCTIGFKPENAAEALLALQNWIEGLK